MRESQLAEPYRFVKPHRGRFWTRLLVPILLPIYRRLWARVHNIEIRGVKHLTDSLAAGHAVALAPNHCRLSDPLMMICLGRAAGTDLWGMGNWNVFQSHPFFRWIGPRLGAFSVLREGIDRESLNCAIELLSEAQRPLVIFPEGGLSRTNDLTINLLDGLSFVTRMAARKFSKSNSSSQVVVHPVALKYFYLGDLKAAAEPILSSIERQHGTAAHDVLFDRIMAALEAVLGAQETTRFGSVRTGTVFERIDLLIGDLLPPLEEHYALRPQAQDVISRVVSVRTAVRARLINEDLSAEDREECGRHLATLELVHELSLFPPNYLTKESSAERYLETLERLDELMTGEARPQGPFRLIVEVGPAIPVSSERVRGAVGDALTQELRRRLQDMLDKVNQDASSAQLTVEGPLKSGVD